MPRRRRVWLRSTAGSAQACRDKPWNQPLAAIAAQHANLPPRYSGTPPVSAVLNTSITTPTRQALAVPTGGVMLVFLALAANVVILLLSRLSQRQHEIATCAALGASRSRLLRQIALEHMFIGAIGIALGVAVASAITTAFPSYFLFRTLNVVDIDARALAAASLCGSLAVLSAGLVSAWMASRHEPCCGYSGGHRAGTAADPVETGYARASRHADCSWRPPSSSAPPCSFAPSSI